MTVNLTRKPAVVLLQLGGPDSPEAVEPFLYNLFRDPDIIDLPGAFLFRKTLARLISRFRSPKVRELYKAIGNKSPILDQTKQQADSLKKHLASHGYDLPVEIAMRYWHPFTEEAVRKLTGDGVKEFVLLPLYPHYSKATTGSSVREWQRVLGTLSQDSYSTHLIEPYFEHPLYIDALVDVVREAIGRVPQQERSKIHLVFSAHGTPLKLVRDGDPYSHQIRRTYELVLERGGFNLPHHLCFQSKVGPQKWLEPSLVDTIRRLGTEGVTHIVINPIAFVSDHIETLSEINIEVREEARHHGIATFEMTSPLLSRDLFIRCLGDLVIRKLEAAS